MWPRSQAPTLENANVEVVKAWIHIRVPRESGNEASVNALWKLLSLNPHNDGLNVNQPI